MRLLQPTIVSCFLATLLGLCPLAQVHADQSQRQQLVAAAIDGCQKTQQLEGAQLRNFQQKQTAFALLTKHWSEKMPPDMRENVPAQLKYGLDRERAAFKVLLVAAQATDTLLSTCEALKDDTTHATIAQFAHTGAQLDDDLKQIQARWSQMPQARADFKSSLSKSTDLLISYDPTGTSAYITMKVQLDPDTFDLVITNQEALLLPALIAFKVLQ